MREWITNFLLLALLVVPTAVADEVASSQKTLLIVGASTMQPVIEELAGEYTKLTGLEIAVRGGGTKAALEQIQNGTADVGMVILQGREEKLAGLSQLRIATEALAIVAHETMPLRDVSRELLRSLYQKEITSLTAEGGRQMPVYPISRAPGRSSRLHFEEFIFGEPGGTAVQMPDKDHMDLVAESNLELLLLVSGLPGSIGYVSHPDAQKFAETGMPLRILSVNGVPPTPKALLDGEYPLVRQLYLVAKPGNERAKEFLEFVRERRAAFLEPGRVARKFMGEAEPELAE